MISYQTISGLRMVEKLEPAPRRRLQWQRVWWASVPIWSLGMLSCVPFFKHALASKRTKDWVVMLGYLAATIGALVLLAVGGDASKPHTTTNALGSVGAGIVILLMGVGSVHTWVLYRQRVLSAAPADTNAAVLAAAREASRRRAEARGIVEKDAVLARDLKIGRPDLGGSFDDGGLVDVNHAPVDLLVRRLGWTAAEARSVDEIRVRLGGFSGIEEFSAYARLAPDRIDAVAYLLVFRRV